jgi:hypothetical protein
MSKNYISLDLGGKKMGFKLNNKTIDFIGELSGVDPLAFGPKASSWVELKAYVCTLLHAGLLSDLYSKEEQPTFSADDVTKWMDDLAPKDIYLIAGLYREFMNPSILSAGGETGEDTQGQAANMA